MALSAFPKECTNKTTRAMEPSASIYTSLNIHFHDVVVPAFSSAFAWRCSTRFTLLPFYEKHTRGSSAHLEMASGTGYYPPRQPTQACSPRRG